MSTSASANRDNLSAEHVLRVSRPHLVVPEQVLATASRSLDDPETPRTRDASFPWSMALANMLMSQELGEALERAADWRGARVLDAGCGPGVVTQAIAGFGVSEVVGVDKLPSMLEAATAFGVGGGNLSLRQADLTRLPFPSASFDIVACGDVPLVDAIRTELWRVLRPGGMLVYKRTGIVAGCTFVWDPQLETRYRAAVARGMDTAGPPWSSRKPGWHLEELIAEAEGPPAAFTTVVAQASAPLPELWRTYIGQRFAAFEGPFLRAGASAEDWATISALLDPSASGSLYERNDAYLAESVSVISLRASV